MVSRSVIYWEVETQADFLLPDGKLYVPGAEKLIPNLSRLTNAAREDRVLILGDACFHAPNDPEFERFPPHCIRGTPGAEIIPEARAARVLFVPNRADAGVPQDLSEYQQVILEKQTLNVFDNPNAPLVLQRAARFTDPDAEIFVFGVVTEYCVRLAAKGLLERGRRVALIRDAIETLNADEGGKAIEELTSLILTGAARFAENAQRESTARIRGARLVTTEQALAALDATKSRSA